MQLHSLPFIRHKNTVQTDTTETHCVSSCAKLKGKPTLSPNSQVQFKKSATEEKIGEMFWERDAETWGWTECSPLRLSCLKMSFMSTTFDLFKAELSNTNGRVAVGASWPVQLSTACVSQDDIISRNRLSALQEQMYHHYKLSCKSNRNQC